MQLEHTEYSGETDRPARGNCPPAAVTLTEMGESTSTRIVRAVRFPGPTGLVRLENWRHALDQGTVAGRNAAGAREAYTTVPSFWSEQYDLYIQSVGWSVKDAMTVHRPLAGDGMLVFEMSDGCLAYAVGINAQRDLALARRLIERRVAIDPAALANPAQPLAAMLKR